MGPFFLRSHGLLQRQAMSQIIRVRRAGHSNFETEAEQYLTETEFMAYHIVP